MKKDIRYKAAVKRVKKKKGFYKHLIAYLAVNAALGLVVFLDEGSFEGFFPAIFWGVGLVIHYFNVFGFPGAQGIGSDEWEQREIEKEMEKMGYYDEEDHLDLDDRLKDPELELKEIRPRKSRYDDSDLV